jgi:hypothetical protein
MILTISSIDRLGSVMEASLVYSVVTYMISGVRGLIKNDYATEISSGLYHVVVANGTCTGNGKNLKKKKKLRLAAVLVSGLAVLNE